MTLREFVEYDLKHARELGFGWVNNEIGDEPTERYMKWFTPAFMSLTKHDQLEVMKYAAGDVSEVTELVMQILSN